MARSEDRHRGGNQRSELLSAPSPLSRTLEVYTCPVLDREQEIVDVGNVINSYKAALAVGVQDPRRGNLDPRVAAGTVQGPQRPLGITRRDANDGWIAASSDHEGPPPTAA